MPFRQPAFLSHGIGAERCLGRPHWRSGDRRRRGHHRNSYAAAVVVQRTLGDQGLAGREVGDPIPFLLAMSFATAGGQPVGVTLTDGTAFDLSSNARMAMTSFIYDPNSKSNSV